MVFERRFSEGHAERFPELAAELVRLRVDLILVPTTPAALAAKHATQTIPIVIPAASDPVGAGLVASLARPGGNITGLSPLNAELSGKRLELLKKSSQAYPGGGPLECGESRQHVGVARDAGGGTRVGPPAPIAGSAGPPGPRGRVRPQAQARPDALLVLTDSLINMHGRQIAEFAIQQHLPSVFTSGNWSWPAA